jgi:hypothetical protein
VTAALEDIGIDVTTLPEPEPEHETPSLDGRPLRTPCSLAVSQTYHTRWLLRNIAGADDQLSVLLWTSFLAATKSCLRKKWHMTSSLGRTGLLSKAH